MTATFDPNEDFGAQYIVFTDPGSSAAEIRHVAGWGAAGEGWPHLTPVIATPDGPQPLPFHPGRRFTYAANTEDAAYFARQPAGPLNAD